MNQLSPELLNGTRVLVRIAVGASAGPLDDSSIEACVPTIRYLLDAGARVIVATHLRSATGGRDDIPSLDRLAVRLESVLGRSVPNLSTAVGGAALRAIAAMTPSGVVLLQNLAYYAEDDVNEPDFARQLATLADIYCDEAFDLAHHSLASTVGITRFVPVSVAGLDMSRQIKVIDAVAQHTESPFLAILGGNRIEETLPGSKRFFRKVDRVFIAGALAVAFLKAQGHEVGAYEPNEDSLRLIQDFVEAVGESSKIILPDDFVCIDKRDWRELPHNGNRSKPPAMEIVPTFRLLPWHVPVDVGPITILRIGTLLEQSRTLFWHGPLGLSQVEAFAAGTREVAGLVIEKHSTRFQSILCGHSLVRTIRNSGLDVEHIGPMSTAGQSVIDIVAGDPLPGVEALVAKNPATPSAAARRTILIPVDDEERSIRVLRSISRMLELSGTEIHLIYPHERPLLASAKAGLFHGERQKEDPWRMDAERIFALADAILSRSGAVPHARIIVEGEPVSCILDYRDRIGADLIAMGCRGFTRAQRLVLGEPSQTIADRARCPVLLLRIPEEESGEEARGRGATQ
ncbi:MAG TPA: phosphoglycerate kinase [Candidatus Acidoferrum sp.]|nr:phosphoglycerate kinase [Candidatus Acidoferrum sp.]